MNRKGWFTLLGAVVVVSLTTWLGPTILSWWFTPPVDTLFNCKGPIEWALRSFQKSQLIGLLAGAVLGFMASFIFRGKSKHPELEA